MSVPYDVPGLLAVAARCIASAQLADAIVIGCGDIEEAAHWAAIARSDRDRAHRYNAIAQLRMGLRPGALPEA